MAQLHNYLAANVLKKPVVIEEFGLTWFKKTPAQQRVLFKVGGTCVYRCYQGGVCCARDVWESVVGVLCAAAACFCISASPREVQSVHQLLSRHITHKPLTTCRSCPLAASPLHLPTNTNRSQWTWLWRLLRQAVRWLVPCFGTQHTTTQWTGTATTYRLTGRCVECFQVFSRELEPPLCNVMFQFASLRRGVNVEILHEGVILIQAAMAEAGWSRSSTP